MPLLNTATRSAREPFSLLNGGSAGASVRLDVALALPWATGSPEAYPPWPATVIRSAYAGAAITIDATTTDWIVLAVRGVGLRYLRYQDYPDQVDAALGGSPAWARLAEIRGDLLIYPVEQG